MLKLLKRRGDGRKHGMRFTLGIRACTHEDGGHNREDWLVDLSDGIPTA